MGDVHNALSLLDREECSTKVETHVGQSVAGRAPWSGPSGMNDKQLTSYDGH